MRGRGAGRYQRIVIVLVAVPLATLAGSVLGYVIFGDVRDPFATTLAVWVGGWLAFCAVAVWSARLLGGATPTAITSVTLLFFSILAIPAIYINAEFAEYSFNPYAREFWPAGLVQADTEARGIMGSGTALMGGSTSALGYDSGIALACGGGAGHTIGRGNEVLIDPPMPDLGDPLPVQLDNLWSEWNASGFSPTAPTSQYQFGTSRIAFTARSPSGTLLTATLAPNGRPPPSQTMPYQQTRPWTPTELRINLEYETACFAFD